MDNGSKHFTNHDNCRVLLKIVIRMILKIISIGLALVFGFWLLLASNMGPVYLPQFADGALDFWIRMTLLGLGLSTWLITAVWFVCFVLRYCHYLIKYYLTKRRL
ncbi:MAG TPA: hypothetical protein DCX43_05445 [Psychrobacter sp.]|nr:hypothetical protein [Psychrobacter sp.]